MLSNFIQRSITSAILALLFIILCSLPTQLFSLLLIGILIYILHYEWPRLYPNHRWTWYVVTTSYPVLPFALMVYMNEYYHPLFIGMMIMVASYLILIRMRKQVYKLGVEK